MEVFRFVILLQYMKETHMDNPAIRVKDKHIVRLNSIVRKGRQQEKEGIQKGKAVKRTGGGKVMAEYQTIEHTFQPVFDNRSKILILGSLPSVKSRENQFYYGHPQNRFWKLLARLYQSEIPETIEEKKAFLHKYHIALWDVIARCDIIGSSDSSIKNVVPNDMSVILDNAPIKRIYANGGKAYELYMKYCYSECKREIIKLPSTSPANAVFSMERLTTAWRKIIDL